MSDDDRWHFACCGAEVVNERAIEELPLFVVDDFFIQRLTDRLHDTAMKLAVDQ